MKRLFTLLILAALMLSLVACGGENEIKKVDRNMEILGASIGIERSEVENTYEQLGFDILWSKDNYIENDISEISDLLSRVFNSEIDLNLEKLKIAFDDSDKIDSIVLSFSKTNFDEDNILLAMNEYYGISDEAYSGIKSGTADLVHIWFDKDGNYVELKFHLADGVGITDTLFLAYRNKSFQQKDGQYNVDYKNEKYYNNLYILDN